MKKLALLLAVALVATAAPATAATEDLSVEPTLGWDRTFSVDDWNVTRAESLLLLPNGEFAEAGTVATCEFCLSEDVGIYVRAFNADGTEQWSQVQEVAERGGPIELALAGDDMIVATWPSDDGAPLTLAAFSLSGERLWSTPEGTVPTTDNAITANSTRLGVVGSTAGSLAGANQGGTDAYVRSFTADGTHEWDHQFGTASDDQAAEVVLLDDGTLIVAGTTGGVLDGASAGGDDAFVRAYTPTGSVRWTEQFGSAADDSVFSLALTIDGTIVVFGRNSTGPDTWFARGLDADGALVWSASVPVADDDEATDAIVTDDDTLVISGFSGGDSTIDHQDAEGFVRAFDLTGTSLWSDERSETNLSALLQTTDQSILLAGETLALGISRALAPTPGAVPEAPTEVSTRPGIGSLDIAWSGPTGAVVTYTATASPGDETCTTSATECTIPDLDPSVDYTVSVTATNAAGSTDGDAEAAGTALIDCDEGDDAPFTDVPPSSFAIEDVACLWRLELTTGTTATTYSPADAVTREQMASFLARLYRTLANESCVEPHPFTDVADTSFALDDIGCIYSLGVTTGTTATTYSPDDPVTREQMASFLARMYRTLDFACPSGDHPFTDVPDTSFALGDIGCIYNLGVTTGTTATTYSPDDPVTREQMASFLARLVRVGLAT